MVRLRRRACLALFLCALFVFGTLMALRTLKPSDGFSALAPGLQLQPLAARRHGVAAGDGEEPPRAEVQAASHQPAAPRSPQPAPGPEGVSSALHAFYYTWYGTPRFDSRYLHWDHVMVPHWDPKISASYPKGRHSPPDDLGASFYPALGPYSSRDPAVLEEHMTQLRAAAIGVVVLSWYPPGLADDNGEPSESLVPFILDAAHRYAIKVTFHIQPYKGRDDNTVHKNVKYILDRYGTHEAFYRYKTSMGRSLPLFYIYDSYLTPPEAWANLLTPSGSHSLRNTPYDAIFIALLVDEGHKHDILSAGYDGIYTYFASNGFSYGSSHQNWKAIKAFCDANNLLFIPSVGPGYIDTSIRPWNNHNTRNRVNGKYYETALQAALTVRPEIVSITSFNEWHEGTQIEKAVPKKTLTRLYLDYLPHQPDMYLELTRRWAEHYSKEKEQWLM
ncbi:glycoprotein endo-alpha-1,2-mannosidase-like protein isoform X2 [Hemicordylus capensis]|uniref:glycoprotein endo-alpha-1,2-mannosidase-like protein isoform X2 n=1 Tax=Hemicordylus capensis TaxID=884348 RepID=UPI002302BB11|nr:glycoprotein endo-alpha-1,2-mannosidase-like protein isoform X2 [Hemicordylus capensis]